jgi:hypothetical protein
VAFCIEDLSFVAFCIEDFSLVPFGIDEVSLVAFAIEDLSFVAFVIDDLSLVAFHAEDFSVSTFGIEVSSILGFGIEGSWILGFAITGFIEADFVTIAVSPRSCAWSASPNVRVAEISATGISFIAVVLPLTKAAPSAQKCEQQPCSALMVGPIMTPNQHNLIAQQARHHPR